MKLKDLIIEKFGEAIDPAEVSDKSGYILVRLKKPYMCHYAEEFNITVLVVNEFDVEYYADRIFKLDPKDYSEYLDRYYNYHHYVNDLRDKLKGVE